MMKTSPCQAVRSSGVVASSEIATLPATLRMGGDTGKHEENADQSGPLGGMSLEECTRRGQQLGIHILVVAYIPQHSTLQHQGSTEPMLGKMGLPRDVGCSGMLGHLNDLQGQPQTLSTNQKKLFTLLDLCVSSLRRGHANLLCIVPILTDDPRRESNEVHTHRHRDSLSSLKTFGAFREWASHPTHSLSFCGALRVNVGFLAFPNRRFGVLAVLEVPPAVLLTASSGAAHSVCSFLWQCCLLCAAENSICRFLNCLS